MTHNEITDIRSCRTILAGKYLRQLTSQDNLHEPFFVFPHPVKHEDIKIHEREFNFQTTFPERYTRRDDSGYLSS